MKRLSLFPNERNADKTDTCVDPPMRSLSIIKHILKSPVLDIVIISVINWLSLFFSLKVAHDEYVDRQGSRYIFTLIHLLHLSLALPLLTSRTPYISLYERMSGKLLVYSLQKCRIRRRILIQTIKINTHKLINLLRIL